MNANRISLIGLLCLFSISIIIAAEQSKPTPVTAETQKQSAAYHLERARVCKKDDNLEQALTEYQQALSYDLTCLEAHFNLGVIFFTKQQFDSAIHHFTMAKQAAPTNAPLSYNLSIALKNKGAIDEAIQELYTTIRLDPTYKKALELLIALLQSKNRHAEVSELYTKLLALDPQNSSAYRSLAEKAVKDEHYELALSYIKKAVELSPNNHDLLFELGIAYTRLGRIDEAVATYDIILREDFNLTALYNSGYALKMAGRVDEAIEKYKKVISIDPTYEPAQFALGHAYLNNGDFKNGWAQHERYLKQSNKNSDKLRTFLRENCVNGKTILFRPEGGLGDSLQFIRYGQLLKSMGANVIAIIQEPLVPLLSLCPYLDLVTSTKDVSTIKVFDDSATLMSLPAIFNSDETTIPRNIPYLFPDPTLVMHWHEQLAPDKNFKIGICWQADVFNDSSRLPVARRGIPLSKLYPLGLLKGVSLYSLQRKEGLEQLKNLPPTFTLTRFDDSFDVAHGSFMDSAAVITQLDLVITVDTAIAHLAGGLGIPVWILLPYSTDWRWIAHRTDNPWYPSMHIFKQPIPFDWDSVINNILLELIKKLQEKK